MTLKQLRIPALFLLVVLLAYGGTLWQGFAPMDDDLLVVRNLASHGPTWHHLVLAFTTFDPELYIPLTFVSYQLNFLIGGLHPFIYHLTNLLLHTGNALLVAALLSLLTGKRTLAIIAGLIFAVHPLQTEAVAWIAARKDLLSTFFFLLSWILYIRHRQSHRMNLYAWSVAVFALGLLSKVMVLTLPAVLLLSDILIERRRMTVRLLIDKIPYAALSGIFLGVAALGKERILAKHSLWETALMAGKSTAFYLQKFFVPVRLGVFYPYKGEISLLLPGFWIPALLMIVLIGAAIFFLRRARWFTFGITFFLLTLAPTFFNFHKGGEIYFASDRYPYLPLIGLLFVLVMGISLLAERRVISNASVTAASVPVIFLLCVLSFFQTRMWNSPQALFERTLLLHPQSIAARTVLASMARQQGRYDEAIALLREGLTYGDDVKLRMGLGTVYAKIGRVDDAVDQFRQAEVLDPQNPEPIFAQGNIDEHFGRMDEAMAKYRKAVEMDSSYVAARNRLGNLLRERGDLAGAEAQFRAALAWNPNADGVLYNLALLLEAGGKNEEALALLQKAAALVPESAQIQEALTRLLGKGTPQE